MIQHLDCKLFSESCLLEIFFAEFKVVLGTFCFENFTDCWRTTEKDGHFSFPFILQSLKYLK